MAPASAGSAVRKDKINQPTNKPTNQNRRKQKPTINKEITSTLTHTYTNKQNKSKLANKQTDGQTNKQTTNHTFTSSAVPLYAISEIAIWIQSSALAVHRTWASNCWRARSFKRMIPEHFEFTPADYLVFAWRNISAWIAPFRLQDTLACKESGASCLLFSRRRCSRKQNTKVGASVRYNATSALRRV